MAHWYPSPKTYRATCVLCDYEGKPRSLELAWTEQDRHADSRVHQMAVIMRDTPSSDEQD